MSYVRTLQTLGAADLPIAGGKAANLGELIRAGLNVPPGFVVTTAAYRDGDSPAFESEVIAAYRQLGGKVAVRSSATAEDLPGASFAGLHESFLQVAGEEAVLAAIRRCWASLHAEPARAYRRAQRIDETGLAMAVIVQAMAPAETSGVLFTRNPISGIAGEMMVNAMRGTGERLVSGEVTPDQWVCRPDGSVLSFTPAPRPGPGGQTRGCLYHGQVSELVRLARQVEAHFGAPQDLEWSYGQGRFHMLQARPITAP